MKKLISLFIFTAVILAACNSGRKQQTPEEQTTPTEDFMEQLSEFCGEELQGKVLTDQNHPGIVDKPMSFLFEKCSAEEIRITASLPIEEKTVIIFTLMGNELLLKHDVRDADSSPAQYTMYGGFADESGNETMQIFPVHNFGGNMWPGYDAYSWEICINPKEGTLEYMEVAEDVVKKHYIARIPS